MGAVEHLKTLCCLGLPPESAMIAVTPLLHEIIPHGWTRIWQMAPDATFTSGYFENPAAVGYGGSVGPGFHLDAGLSRGWDRLGFVLAGSQMA